MDKTWQLASVKDSSAARDGSDESWARTADGHRCRKRAPRPGKGTPKGSAHLVALCTTPGQLPYFVALALQQHGQQSALCKSRRCFSHDVIFLFFLVRKDSVIYVVFEYGLAVFSERLTVSCLANPRVGKGATNLLTPALCFIP